MLFCIGCRCAAKRLAFQSDPPDISGTYTRHHTWWRQYHWLFPAPRFPPRDRRLGTVCTSLFPQEASSMASGSRPFPAQPNAYFRSLFGWLMKSRPLRSVSTTRWAGWLSTHSPFPPAESPAHASSPLWRNSRGRGPWPRVSQVTSADPRWLGDRNMESCVTGHLGQLAEHLQMEGTHHQDLKHMVSNFFPGPMGIQSRWNYTQRFSSPSPMFWAAHKRRAHNTV